MCSRCKRQTDTDKSWENRKQTEALQRSFPSFIHFTLHTFAFMNLYNVQYLVFSTPPATASMTCLAHIWLVIKVARLGINYNLFSSCKNVLLIVNKKKQAH
jgi:hypothetical protein